MSDHPRVKALSQPNAHAYHAAMFQLACELEDEVDALKAKYEPSPAQAADEELRGDRHRQRIRDGEIHPNGSDVRDREL